MRQTIRMAVVLGVLGAVGAAHGWSAGPYSFERCTKEFPIAVHGSVQRVQVVGTRGKWVLSRATVSVSKAHGLRWTAKRLSFYFWSSTSLRLTLPHSIKRGEELLVFLSRDLAPLRGWLPAGAKRAGFFLRFAKANHRGYLFKVERPKSGAIVRDAIFAKRTISLTKARRLLR